VADVTRLKQQHRGFRVIDVGTIEYVFLGRTDEGNVRLDVVEAAWLIAEVLPLMLNDCEAVPHGPASSCSGVRIPLLSMHAIHPDEHVRPESLSAPYLAGGNQLVPLNHKPKYLVCEDWGGAWDLNHVGNITARMVDLSMPEQCTGIQIVRTDDEVEARWWRTELPAGHKCP
jgi:hypothetical protein